MNTSTGAKQKLQNFLQNSAGATALTQAADISFHFGIDLLDTSIHEIHKHTVSSNLQISAVTAQCLSYVCAYGGLNGCESYVFDLSPGAAGKDSAFDKAYELILKPVMDIQNAKKAKYDYERQSNEEKLPTKSFYCVHTSDATEQGLIQGFQSTKSQFVAVGEISNKLRKKEDPLMNFITRVYGKKSIVKPNYKKDLGDSGDLTIDGISLFFYGNSNLQMMGRSTFKHHLVGGLLNRCSLIYSTKKRPFEDRPKSYDLEESVIQECHLKVDALMSFAEAHADKPKPSFVQTEDYVAFDRYIYDITNEYAGSEVEYLFKRVIQNLNALIHTFNYLLGAQENVWHEVIPASTVNLGVEYMKYILEGYEVLIDEIIGASEELRDEDRVSKLHDTIFALSEKNNTLKLRHRDIYRAAHLKREQYDRLIKGMHYKTDKNYLYVLPEPTVTSVTRDKTSDVA